MPSAVAVHPPRSPLHPAGPKLAALAAVVATALAAVPLWTAFRPADTVDLTVHNPGRREVHLTVRGPDDDAVLPVGRVEPDERYRFHEVLDLGDTWVVAFDSAGVPAGELTLTRDELAHADWTIEVPPAVDQQLADRGVAPSP